MQYTKLLKRRTKIVGTIGPASNSVAIIERLIRAGMNVARLNLAHGSKDEHSRYIRTIRRIARRLAVPVAIIMDIPGPKYRVGNLRDGSVRLKKRANVVLTTRDVEGNTEVIPVNLATFPRNARAGSKLLVDDGAIQLKVLDISGTEVKCRVIVGGVVIKGRGIVIPRMRGTGDYVTDRLREYINLVIELEPDYIALSFVNRPEDVEQTRAILHQSNCAIPIITKIEQVQALANFDRLLRVSDGIMVARGDLGVDIPLQKVPLVQKDIIRKCNQVGKPVITATQMLESMINSARPTRAEVTDVANAIFDGTDALMLSAETSIGKYAVPSVRMMAQIAEVTERQLPYEDLLVKRGAWLENQTDELIAYNACYTANKLGAVAIVAFTESGSTGQRVSKYRPKAPILAITSSKVVCRKLQLLWGVHAFPIGASPTISALFSKAAGLAKDVGIARASDTIVITGGVPLGTAGTTNLLKVEMIT